jgi:hypothetical protein
VKRIFYHGTSAKNADLIAKEGFKADGVKHHWEVKSKKGFVYFSLAYAPFYAMASDDDEANEEMLALIKVEIDEDDLYPEDDFIFYAKGKPKYTQAELDKLDFERLKFAWRDSIKYMGNVCAKPDKVKVLGIRKFLDRDLIMKCDPVISPMNYKIMGDYYLRLTEHIFEGGKIMEFKSFGMM